MNVCVTCVNTIISLPPHAVFSRLLHVFYIYFTNASSAYTVTVASLGKGKLVPFNESIYIFYN